MDLSNLSDEGLVAEMLGAAVYGDTDEADEAEKVLLSRLRAAREDTKRLDWLETMAPDIRKSIDGLRDAARGGTDE